MSIAMLTSDVWGCIVNMEPMCTMPLSLTNKFLHTVACKGPLATVLNQVKKVMSYARDLEPEEWILLASGLTYNYGYMKLNDIEHVMSRLVTIKPNTLLKRLLNRGAHCKLSTLARNRLFDHFATQDNVDVLLFMLSGDDCTQAQIHNIITRLFTQGDKFTIACMMETKQFNLLYTAKKLAAVCTDRRNRPILKTILTSLCHKPELLYGMLQHSQHQGIRAIRHLGGKDANLILNRIIAYCVRNFWWISSKRSGLSMCLKIYRLCIGGMFPIPNEDMNKRVIRFGCNYIRNNSYNHGYPTWSYVSNEKLPNYVKPPRNVCTDRWVRAYMGVVRPRAPFHTIARPRNH